MRKFKAFSDVVLGSSFNNDGSTWHGYILSTKQWAQIFFNHCFFKLYYFSMTVLNWGTWVKENSTITFFVFLSSKSKNWLLSYFINSITCEKDWKALHKVLLILDPYQWKYGNYEKSLVHLPHRLLFAWICLLVPG